MGGREGAREGRGGSEREWGVDGGDGRQLRETDRDLLVSRVVSMLSSSADRRETVAALVLELRQHPAAEARKFQKEIQRAG